MIALSSEAALSRFAPLVELYRRASGRSSATRPLPVGLHTIGYVGKTDEGSGRGPVIPTGRR